MLWTFFTLLYFNTPEKKRAWQCEVITCLLQFYIDLVQLSTENNFKKIFRGTQREILRKRPKNNNKAWLKISEAILSILGKICLLNILRYILSLAYWNLYCHKKRKMIRIWNLSKTVKFCTSRRKVDIDQYLQTQYLLTSNNHRSRSAGNNEALLLDRCALRKFHATDSQNTRDQISSDSKSKRACSNWVLCIPFILSGSPSAPFVISEIAPN